MSVITTMYRVSIGEIYWCGEKVLAEEAKFPVSHGGKGGHEKKDV